MDKSNLPNLKMNESIGVKLSDWIDLRSTTVSIQICLKFVQLSIFAKAMLCLQKVARIMCVG